MRPFPPGSGIVASSSSIAGPAACARPAAGKSSAPKISLCGSFISWLLLEGDAPGQSEPQLANRFTAGVRRANSDVERQVVARPPDGADKPRQEPGASGRLLAEHFGDRTHGPGVGAFEDRAKEHIRFMLAVDRKGAVEVQAHRLGALRNDARHGKTRPVLATDRRKKNAVLRRHAETGLLLQHAVPEDLLDEEAVLDDGGSRLAGLGIDRHLPLALNHKLAVFGEAVVPDHGRRNPESPVALAEPAQRAQLELEFPRRSDGRVGGIVRP